VVKWGVGPTASAALRHEAAVLQAMRHPGVVELVAVETRSEGVDPRTRLITRFAGVHTLQCAPPGSPALALTRAAQLLATLAALHGRGLTHGAVDPTHVVVDPMGVTRWCGLRRTRSAPAAARSQELRAAASLASTALANARLPIRGRRAALRQLDTAFAVLDDVSLDTGAAARRLVDLLAGTPNGATVGGRRRSAEPYGNLVGEETPGDRQDEAVTTSFHQSVEHAPHLSR